MLIDWDDMLCGIWLWFSLFIPRWNLLHWTSYRHSLFVGISFLVVWSLWTHQNI